MQQDSSSVVSSVENGKQILVGQPWWLSHFCTTMNMMLSFQRSSPRTERDCCCPPWTSSGSCMGAIRHDLKLIDGKG